MSLTSNPEQRTLIDNADFVITMDQTQAVLEHASVGIRGNQIEQVGGDFNRAAYDRVVDGTGKVVIPGLINAHHHAFQGLMRGFPAIQNRPIESWIGGVSQLVEGMDEDILHHVVQASLAELVLYGCTTSTDMMYVAPAGNGDWFQAEIEAAESIGVRFHPYRGSMSLSRKDGALFSDNVVQDADTIAAETEALINRAHDPGPFSMLRIGAAPCTPYTSSAQDFLNAAELSRRHNVLLQTHVAESTNEIGPVDYLMGLGWDDERASFVHCVNVNDEDIATMAVHGTHVVHCPVSTARGSVGEPGIAPITEMLEAGINVALGTDGSASGDSASMVEQLKWARILQGARPETTYLDPSTVLSMATTNGAQLLRWPELGSIEVGKAADVAVFDLNTLEFSGTWDPLTALVSIQSRRADTVIVNGKILVENAHLVDVDEAGLVAIVKKDIQKLQTQG